MKDKLRFRGREDYAYAVIAAYKHDKSLNGLNIVEATKKVRGSDSLDDQIEMVFGNREERQRVRRVSRDERRGLANVHATSNTMIACDSGLREFGKDVPHPRGYGNNARVLGRYYAT